MSKAMSTKYLRLFLKLTESAGCGTYLKVA